jgi:SAM-dependent methyltransferase
MDAKCVRRADDTGSGPNYSQVMRIGPAGRPNGTQGRTARVKSPQQRVSAPSAFCPLGMKTSVVYRSARGYELLMRLLYGRHYEARMRVVAEQIPWGASVLELCCGPGTLYFRYLHHRAAGYVGLDVNPRFVARLRRSGVDARCLDLTSDAEPLPVADVVIMQASLYHFLPEAGAVLDRMLAAARESVIVSEPIRNLASSALPGVALLGRRAADPGVGGHAGRFTEATLDQLMEGHRGQVASAFKIPGGREKVYVLRPESSSTPPAPRAQTT